MENKILRPANRCSPKAHKGLAKKKFLEISSLAKGY
jgi:hypothetical protein